MKRDGYPALAIWAACLTGVVVLIGMAVMGR